MTTPLVEAPTPVPAESLTVTPPHPVTQSMEEASRDFIARYRAEDKTTVPAPDAPEVPVEAPTSPVDAPEVEKATEAQGEGEKPSEGQQSQFRNPDGTFAKAIKAKFGETEMEVPEALLIPLKRGETVEMKPLADVLKEGMLYNDYNKSKQELADQRRTFAAENAAAKAEVQVWKAVAKEILENPAKAMKYRQDPELANLWADAAEGRLVQARQEAMAEVSQRDASSDAVAQIKGWAEAMASEFPGVDSQSVLREYGEYLYQHGEAVRAGRAMEDPGAISMDRLRTYFSNHHQRVAQVTSPLQAQIEAMQKELAALKAEKAKESVAKTVQHASERQKAPPVIAGTGGVAAGNTGAITGPNGQKLSTNDAHREFLKRYQ